MSKKPSGSAPPNLPDDFFDANKRSKKEQEHDLAKELEEFEREMAVLQAESDEQLKEEFEKLQEEKNLDELDEQISQWKRIVELEKRAEELKNKPISENPTKKLKIDSSSISAAKRAQDNPFAKRIPVKIEDEADGRDLDDIEDFEDKLSNWRSKAI